MEWLVLGVLALGVYGVYQSIITFAMFLLLILLLSGLIWLADKFYFANKRATDTAEPVAVEYAKSFFPIILVVFLIRSFIVEPFKIPSESMVPTLLVGDYILVNKYTYGLRVPITNDVFYKIGAPERGDVFVFHFPLNTKIDYIKRVIGLPGDKIQYQNKQLTINGQKVEQIEAGSFPSPVALPGVTVRRYQEQLGDVKHEALVFDGLTSRIEIGSLGDKLDSGETITVPEGFYFAMGDNRDNSADSRVWGFVPEKNLVGKAFFIWFNFGEFGRIGNSIN